MNGIGAPPADTDLPDRMRLLETDGSVGSATGPPPTAATRNAALPSRGRRSASTGTAPPPRRPRLLGPLPGDGAARRGALPTAGDALVHGGHFTTATAVAAVRISSSVKPSSRVTLPSGRRQSGVLGVATEESVRFAGRRASKRSAVPSRKKSCARAAATLDGV